MKAPERICLIGLGEVGTILADDLCGSGAALSAWDLRFADPASGPSRAAAARPLRAGADAGDAVRGADLVISAVTAAQAAAAARAAAPALVAGAHYLDLNSASPASKAEAAALVAERGGRYVEAAVMAAVPPHRMAAPMLLGGPHAEAFLPLAHRLGFARARFFSAEYGRAAAAKLCRSVIVKGLEALVLEALLAARRHGVEDAVLVSLDSLVAGADWPALARHMISRALEHGARRAEEMREAARTVSEAGLAPLMSAACAERQQWASRFGDVRAESGLVAMLDAIPRRTEGEGAA
jgi:3-hydroxyisobutyrate dehydrogenase-like beta-hydroxyacid dehydrogenase